MKYWQHCNKELKSASTSSFYFPHREESTSSRLKVFYKKAILQNLKKLLKKCDTELKWVNYSTERL